ncbi:hypothetical protein DFH09DRAFT_1307108 [Mycena vulgaris]|nr:hypothetical protein DFH09DRAFT_1307108 [Mycena vulgaris]
MDSFDDFEEMWDLIHDPFASPFAGRHSGPSFRGLGHDRHARAANVEESSIPLPRLKLSNTTSVSPKFKATPIDVVCEIFKFVATADIATAAALLSVSKAIHNLILPILYDTVCLQTPEAATIFAQGSLTLVPVEGCLRPFIRTLNTLQGGSPGPAWSMIAHGRPEVEHVCLTMMDLHAMASLDKQLHPYHIGIIVDGIHMFPDYIDPPLRRPLRITRPTVLRKTQPPRLLTQSRRGRSRYEDVLTPEISPPHATFFMWATHIYFVDNMPPDLDPLRPYLQGLTHFSFAYRRDYGLQLQELSAVLSAVLDIASIELVLVVRKAGKSKKPWDEEEKYLLRSHIHKSCDPRVVFFDDLPGSLSWEEDEAAIWSLAEEKRSALAPLGF